MCIARVINEAKHVAVQKRPRRIHTCIKRLAWMLTVVNVIVEIASNINFLMYS
jgi:hypothetical protein